jgi:hypothetical protein
MIQLLKRLFKREPTFPEGFPLEKLNCWYCGDWYCYREKQQKKGEESRSDYTPWPVEGVFVFNHHVTGIYRKSDPRHCGSLVDGLVPAFKLDGQVGLYEVTDNRSPKNRFYDGLPWDDGRHIDLKLVKVVPEERLALPAGVAEVIYREAKALLLQDELSEAEQFFLRQKYLNAYKDDCRSRMHSALFDITEMLYRDKVAYALLQKHEEATGQSISWDEFNEMINDACDSGGKSITDIEVELEAVG